MLNFYKLSAIPILLKNFKVKKTIISGLLNENLMKEILKYESEFIVIGDAQNHTKIKTINGNPLEVLKFQENYDAIFIADDPNWYTVYNELNLVKNTNKEFPIVFICNNRFPNKRRDAYKNPKIIPKEYTHKYTNELPIIYENNKIIIEDNYYHACEENTPKNGVLTAIEDFLNENQNICLVDFKFIEDITILCPKSTISKIRISNSKQDSENEKLNVNRISDKLIKNQLLLSYLDKYDISEPISKEKINKTIIDDYENKIHIKDSQIKFKNSQIIGVNSELSIKDLQVKNIESKLVNRKNEINKLENELQSANDEIKYLKNEITETESLANNKEADYKFKISASSEEIDSLKNEINKMESELSILDDKLKTANNQNYKYNHLKSEMENTKKLLNDVKMKNVYQINQLNSKEYCINCFKEEISNNKLEIDYYKNHSIIKKILSPFSYLYLLLKSDSKELYINLKLYKALKNSKCFDIGYYLNNNQDIQKSSWIKYFSPELHYICNGFKEQRKFNKKYFNRNSKEELLEYILTCENGK